MAPSYHINLNHELQSSTKHLEASQLAAAADIQRSCLLTGQNWKRLSVFISINLAIVTLVMGAFVTLDSKGMAPETVKTLQISSILLNSLSITLSAITSLDWRSEAAREVDFVKNLLTLVTVHGDEKLTLGRRRRAHV